MLVGRAAWVSGLKRVDTPERVGAPVVGWEPSKRLVKVNPLGAWTDDDIDRYVEDHRLPRHPLCAAGFVSIGCTPTRRGRSSRERIPGRDVGRTAKRRSAGCTSDHPGGHPVVKQIPPTLPHTLKPFLRSHAAWQPGRMLAGVPGRIRFVRYGIPAFEALAAAVDEFRGGD